MLAADGVYYINGDVGELRCKQRQARVLRDDELVVLLRVVFPEFKKNAVVLGKAVIQRDVSSRNLDDMVIGLPIDFDGLPQAAVLGWELHKEGVFAIITKG